MLETDFQNEGLYDGQEQAEEIELTPADQLRQQWTNQPGPIPLIKQRNVIDQNAELIPWAGMAAIHGWIWPFAFALQGLLVISVLAAGFNWYSTRHSGKLEDDILRLQQNVQTETDREQGIMDATQAEIMRISHARAERFVLRMADHPLSRQEALQQLNASLEDTRTSLEQYKQHAATQERELRAREGALALANSGTPLIFTLALILAAGGVGSGVRRAYSRNPQARNAGDFYLYFATAEGLYLNLAFLAMLHFGLSNTAWGFSGFSESVGPIVWAVFWIGFYVLLLWYFISVASDMYKALQLRQPRNPWGFDNTILFKIHNSFFLMFLALEIPYLGACYLLYHAGSRLI
jgi:hypothetical protein